MNIPIPLRLPRTPFLAAMLLITLILIAGGSAFYSAELSRIQNERAMDLGSIASLKQDQITSWRQERLRDAMIVDSYHLRALLLAWVESGTAPQGLTRLLNEIAGMGRYQGVLVIDSLTGNTLSSGQFVLDIGPDTRALIERATVQRETVFGDFYRCRDCGEVHLDLVAPLLEGDSSPRLLLVLRIDPAVELYRIIQSWPTESDTAETLLARRDGQDVLFLNQLRHVHEPPLSRRQSIERQDLPAAQALMGVRGLFHGRDYRGVQVIADLRPIPDTSWVMVTKVDSSELLAEARFRGLSTFLITSLAILLSGLGLVVAYQRRVRGLLRELLEAEQGRQVAREEVRTILYSIGDGVLATDHEGRVARMNSVAETLTGWHEAEAAGKPLAEVFHIINETSRIPVENPVARVLRDGITAGLANHTLLVARDNTERPIADSAAPIREGSGRISGVVLVFHDQTVEREAARALASDRDNLKAIMDASPVGILVLNENRSILELNTEAARIAGAEIHALVGRGCGDLLGCLRPEGSAHGPTNTPRCTQCAFCSAVEQVLQTGQGVKETEILAPIPGQGDPRWLALRAEPFSFQGNKCVIAVIEDITTRKEAESRDRAIQEETRRLLRVADQSRLALLSVIEDQKQAQQALEESELRLRTFYEQSPLPYHAIDPGGIIVDVNPRWQELFGYTRAEVVGRPYAELLLETEAQSFHEHLASLLGTGTTIVRECSIRTSAGTYKEVSLDARVGRASDGTALQVHCLLRDITEIRRLEREKALFEDMSRQQERLRALGTLASGVAHEINNPLNVILNYGQLILDDPEKGENVKSYAENVVQESERVAAIVRSLLQFARHGNESQSLAYLSDIVQTTLSLVRSMLSKDHIHLRTEVEPGLPPVRCRAQQIRQVLMNLITNARDALNERYPGRDEDKILRVVVSGHSIGTIERWVRLTVEDHGHGIQKEIASRVFDPFFTTKPRDKGTGLGLSISYGIAMEHQGRLTFDSRPGKGTLFHLDLKTSEEDQ